MSETFLKNLRENWTLILFIGGLVAGWTTFGARIGTLEDKVIVLETRDQEKTTQIAAQNVQLSAINTKLDFIIEKIK